MPNRFPAALNAECSSAPIHDHYQSPIVDANPRIETERPFGIKIRRTNLTLNTTSILGHQASSEH
jgi:hypothetical protein